jgi:hypothetical protein
VTSALATLGNQPSQATMTSNGMIERNLRRASSDRRGSRLFRWERRLFTRPTAAPPAH